VQHGHLFQDDAEFDDELFDLSGAARRARQRRNPDARHVTRRPPKRSTADVTSAGATEGDFITTYKPARFEKEWLRSSLRPFYDQRLIVDVLAQVKGGKEANVYRCLSHPDLGDRLLAVKVYRPQRLRNLSNDAMYREGRSILTGTGQPVSKTDHRVMRALGKKTEFGEQVRHTSWLMHEFVTLERLHLAGAAVPEPLSAGENAIVMGYHGDAAMAAPTLNTVPLAPDEAAALFDETLRNIELMLDLGLIHGDLSAYNILYWEGAITLIDFPQVTEIMSNPHASAILRRDVTRVCQYFAQQGHHRDPNAIADDLWLRYGPDDDELPALPPPDEERSKL
jgi:RIO kinase 1